jgi:hypothetical protein
LAPAVARPGVGYPAPPATDAINLPSVAIICCSSSAATPREQLGLALPGLRTDRREQCLADAAQIEPAAALVGGIFVAVQPLVALDAG